MLVRHLMKASVSKILFLLPVLSVCSWGQAPAVVDPTGTLDFAQKAAYFGKTTFTFGTLLGDVATAGFVMVDPPSNYPRNWRDGGAAFGRNLGDASAVTGTLLTTKFLAGAALGEDPRYFPSHSTNPAARLVHALAFTFVDKSDHGTNRLALSNFAGAAAAGFVGEAYLPNGFNDNVHAYQRGFIAFGVLGFRNITYEFRPELRAMGHKMHVIRNP
jgi:hypothetical protein